MTRKTIRQPAFRYSTGALMLSASLLALAAAEPAKAAGVLFSNTGRQEVATGQRTSTGAGVLQVRTDSGATLSFVDEADFRINADGSVDLYSGSVTVAGAGSGVTVIRLPEGVEGRVAGAGNAGVFTASAQGGSNGHALTGQVEISRAGETRRFAAGEMWNVARGGGIARAFAGPSQRTPDAPAPGQEQPDNGPQVADLRGGGPAAAAANGLPVSLGDALAAAGAGSDVLAAARRVEAASANPTLESYPVGDLALLVARAADLSGAYGGTPFPEAQADIIRAYLGYLARNGQGLGGRQGFLAAYSGFLVQYLELIRAGGLPSQFGPASQADITAFLAWQGRTGALAGLAAQDRVLADALLAFLQNGGTADTFAGTYTGLIEAYFAFVRGGGDPAAFSGASTQVIDAYVAFLADSGLASQLDPQDQDLLEAYLENGSFAFAGTYAAALQTYFGYLAAGNLPSASTGLTPAQLRSYLELLAASGQLDRLLGDQAAFYAAYLQFLRDGGSADAFPQLNANIFAGYVPQLQAYFAYLQAGGLPSAFSGDPAQLQAWLEALAQAGALEAFLGENAAFYADYLAWLRGGGAIDGWAGLNVNIFAGYADALADYYAYLASGGLPSGYTLLTQEQIAAYVAALEAQGASAAFLAGLADFYADYFAYLQGGGDPDLFTGLPTLNLPAFADALNAYAAFLAAGGLPGDYSDANLSLLAVYIDALNRSGQLAALLGANADLLSAYFAYLGTGADPDLFTGLPLYTGYIAALNAYYAFLAGGGLPGDYTALTPQQIQAYLATLDAAGGLAAFASLNGFFGAYFTFISGGGDPADFAGIPVYAEYLAALRLYYEFLQGGGLPSAYGALTPAQVQAYLEALNGAGILAAELTGEELSFVLDYLAFLQGGGDADDYTALPVYALYLDAISAFYAYLAAGGLPSGYTALTQEQIEAYLAILDALGLLAANFQGEVLAFYTQYLAYLAGGGTPDDFGSFPTTPSPLLYAAALSSQGARAGTARQVVFGDNNQITGITFATSSGDISFSYTGTLREHGRIGDTVAWTRYERGAANSVSNYNDHLLMGTPATNLPTSGTVQFRLLGGTAPTDALAAAGDAGYFTGRLAVAFQPVPEVGLDLNVYADGRGWNLRTAGGADNPANGGLAVGSTGSFSDLGNLVDTTGIAGNACTAYCNSSVFGSLFGDGGSHLGLSYLIQDESGGLANSNYVNGVSVWGQSGTAITGIGTPPPAGGLNGYEGGFNPTNPLIFHVASFPASGGNFFAGSESGFVANPYALDANGGLTSFTRPNFSRTKGTTTVTDIYGNADALIGRWTSGTPQVSNMGPLTANQGFHYLLTRPVATGFALPTSGVIHYDLLAATRPTVANGAVAPGTFTGDLAIVLGTTPKVAMEATITMPGYVLTYATLGGIANPTQSDTLLQLNVNGSLSFTVPGSGTLASCGIDTCSLGVNGAFAADSDTVGLMYRARPDAVANNVVMGTAIFGNGTLSGGNSGGQYTSTFTGTRTGQVYYTYTRGSLASGFGGSADLVNGGLVNFTSILGTVGKGTASVVEAGDVGAMAWARWTNGTVETRTTVGNADTVIGANGGYHVMTGTPTTYATLQSGGTIDYALIATTSATDNLGSAPGTVTGNLSIERGAAPKAHFDFTLSVGGRSWSVATPTAGVAVTNNSGGPYFGGLFTNGQGTLTTTGDACSFSCTLTVSGAVYGANAQYVGVALGATGFVQGSGNLYADGLAIFGPAGGASGGLPQSTQALATTATVPDWDRWNTGSPADGGAPMPAVTAPGIDAVAASGISYSPEQMAMLASYLADQAARH